MDRNLILAITLSMGVLLLWDLLVAGPQRKEWEAAREVAAQQAAQEDEASKAEIEGATAGGAQISVNDALQNGAGRVPVRTDELNGSINLVGARIDDIELRKFRQTLEDKSPLVRVLSPGNTEHGHFVQTGIRFVGDEGLNQVWTAPTGAVLTETTPVTLTRTSGDLTFEKTISIDDRYMFTIEEAVTNNGAEPEALTPYAFVVQRNIPEDFTNFMILHEGPLGVIGNTLHERKYNTLRKNNEKKKVSESGVGGWIGITNKYWLAAAVPAQDEEINAKLSNVGTREKPVFQSSYDLNTRTIAPGETVVITTGVFSGAKDVDVLQAYEKSVADGGLGIPSFDKAVDWGRLFFLTRPTFHTLDYFGDLTGNFGVAILILTVIVKLLLFPIANKGYEMTTKMKKLQPELEKIRERAGEDKLKLQQDMMALYKKEKLNPVAGCIPLLLQMPIFYALYKTLFVTMEMRHQPFLYISDLSAPDPTTIFNLFGLLPFDPTAAPLIGAFLGIGVLPILMGVSMWFQTKLNPPPADPMQAQIFALLPFFFVFIFAGFAAGLVLYWFWNTFLGILQQWVIMKQNGVEVNFAENLKLPGRKKNPAPGE
ncbi:MAG: membrane protein insertase YidC [Marinicaulis sp.]|nr:membrane protein insertase YidC [Marinicaulis sp.]NNL90333.1 membrane protein insertase YidC [Marinicaulis sp.]